MELFHPVQEVITWDSDQLLSHIQSHGSQWIRHEIEKIDKALEGRPAIELPESFVVPLTPRGYSYGYGSYPHHSKHSKRRLRLRDTLCDLWPHRDMNSLICVFDLSYIFNTDGDIWPHKLNDYVTNEPKLPEGMTEHSILSDFAEELLEFYGNVEVQANILRGLDPKFDLLSETEKEDAQVKHDARNPVDARLDPVRTKAQDELGFIDYGWWPEFDYGELGWRMIKYGGYPKDKRKQAAIRPFCRHGDWSEPQWSLSSLIPLDGPWIEEHDNLWSTRSIIYDEAKELLAHCGVNLRAIDGWNSWLFNGQRGTSEPAIPSENGLSEFEIETCQELIKTPPNWIFKDDADIDLIVGLGVFLSYYFLDAEKKFRDDELAKMMGGQPTFDDNTSRNALNVLNHLFSKVKAAIAGGKSSVYFELLRERAKEKDRQRKNYKETEPRKDSIDEAGRKRQFAVDCWREFTGQDLTTGERKMKAWEKFQNEFENEGFKSGYELSTFTRRVIEWSDELAKQG